MATKTTKKGVSLPRPDRRSKKRSGKTKSGLRLSVEENKLLQQAADLERMSFNLWATRLLLTAAKKRIAQEPTT